MVHTYTERVQVQGAGGDDAHTVGLLNQTAAPRECRRNRHGILQRNLLMLIDRPTLHRVLEASPDVPAAPRIPQRPRQRSTGPRWEHSPGRGPAEHDPKHDTAGRVTPTSPMSLLTT